MLVGEYQHTLDPKGRLVLPAKFRDHFSDGCVITKGQERCLYLFPLEQWAEEEARVRTLPRTNAKGRAFARSFFASADSQVPDKQRRVAINAKLQEYAHLGKDVTLIGLSDRVEIWDTASWDAASLEADDFYAGIEEALSEEGI